MLGQRALVVFLVAFLVRAALAFVINAGRAENVINAELGQISANIAAGRGFSSPLAAGDTPTAWFGPIVPYAWALVFVIFGTGTSSSVLALHVVQLVIGGLCGVLYWCIASRIWQESGASRLHQLRPRGARPSMPEERSLDFLEGRAPRGRAIALHDADLGRARDWIPMAIAVVAACWPVGMPRYTMLWYFVWEDLLVAALFPMSLIWWRDTSWRNTAWLGLVGGLGGLVNIVPLVFLVGVLGFKVVSTRRWFRAETWRCVAVMALALVVMTPWMIRNRIAMGAWIPGRSVTGIVLLQGNNERGDIVQCVGTRHPAMDPEERRKFDQLGELEYNRQAAAEARRYVATHKLVTAKRCLQRFYVFWFTDLFDSWPWQPGPTWWQRGGVWAAWRIGQGLLNLGSVVLLVWGLTRRPIPGFPIFLAFFLLVPLPYYLSISGWGYGHIVRPFVVLYGLLALADWLRQKPLRAIS